MYIVDFQRAGYYQKCYDPDCRGMQMILAQFTDGLSINLPSKFVMSFICSEQNDIALGYRSPLRPVPWDVIPDSKALFSSVYTENCSEIMDIGFDTRFDGNNMENNSCDNGELITDSCKKDSNWWQEAMRYADCIEKMRNAAELSKLVSMQIHCVFPCDFASFTKLLHLVTYSLKL